MGVLFDEKSKTFHLRAKGVSYIFNILDGGHLAHLYYGKSITEDFPDLFRPSNRASFNAPSFENYSFSLDLIMREYPTYGGGDLRSPAFAAEKDGVNFCDLRYMEHKIYQGKRKLEGLPCLYAKDSDVDTLELTLFDDLLNLKVVLSYCVFKNYPVISRSVKVINEGESVILKNVMSASVGFDHMDFRLMQLHGSWARERFVEISPLKHGLLSIDSRRGASSHALNPFMALASPDCGENCGEVYAFSFIYSGNFSMQVEVDEYDTTRVNVGINPFNFSWKLDKGGVFQSPEVVFCYSDEGFGNMSRTFHDLYNNHLIRGKYKKSPRPVLLNSWEAVYFNFNEERLYSLAKSAAEIGAEIFVLDDGWFGERNDDRTSLGDWYVNTQKIRGGLNPLISKINALGLKFGIWVEPEMVSPKSRLYEEHPDWCLHIEGRNRTTARSQLILDFSREDVCEYIYNTIRKLLSEHNIEYVKWDMNRNFSEIGSVKYAQGEVPHRYILGLYGVLERLVSEFPNVLFESCSGGGGRFDAGMLYYMPQTWTSDNTDAISRLKIHYGTSMVYPPSSMGSHFSACPNHQTGRVTPVKTRFNVAITGNFGLEFDPANLKEDEKEVLKAGIKKYKEIRHLLQYGDLYRLKNPFVDNAGAFMFVSKEKDEFFVSFTNILTEANSPLKRLKLSGLVPGYVYKNVDNHEIMSGSLLMNYGLKIPHFSGDFASYTWHFRKI